MKTTHTPDSGIALDSQVSPSVPVGSESYEDGYSDLAPQNCDSL